MKLSNISEGILFEAGMSRLIRHAGRSPFAVLTAFRGDFSLADNRLRNRELEGEFRKIGVGGIKIIGHWREAPEGMWFGRNVDEMDPAQLVDVVEESYFVPLPSHLGLNEFNKWVMEMVNRFSQDAAIFSDGATVFLIDKVGELTVVGKGVSVGKIQQAYSSLRGKTFVFEGTMSPSSNAHRMLLQKRNVDWVN